jgi:tRNA threonylcarbamoyladenosine biosynthesis protein TsaB
MIERITVEAGIVLKEIKAVAVSAGPGSYTGLRIGASTAKGLCYALDIPLIAIGSLELLAYQGNAFNQGEDWLCPMIDARRMEVYCLVADQQLNMVEPVSARVIDENSYAEKTPFSWMEFTLPQLPWGFWLSGNTRPVHLRTSSSSDPFI